MLSREEELGTAWVGLLMLCREELGTAWVGLLKLCWEELGTAWVGLRMLCREEELGLNLEAQSTPESPAKISADEVDKFSPNLELVI